MSKELKVGDRVRCYSNLVPYVGIVQDRKSSFEGMIVLKALTGEHTGDNRSEHPQACRRLKPKKPRRRVWVNEYPDRDFPYAYWTKEKADSAQAHTRISCTEFIEVRRGKR